MKPLRLEIEGINSFRERQTVDFEALSQCNLFCISGKTGSGKTTVLDCVILALYEKLPSFSSRGKLEDYINLSCEKGEIKLTFSLEGKIYRSERVISRKRGSNSMRLVDVEAGAAVYEKNDEAFGFLREAIGLDVDQFAQVIILQQGAFAKFLRAPKAERNKMVVNLFRLSRFEEVYSRLHDAAEKLNAELEKFDVVLKEYEGDTAEAYKELLTEIKNKERALREAKKNHDALSVLLTAARENAVRARKYADALAKSRQADEMSANLNSRLEKLHEKEEKLRLCREKQPVLAEEKGSLIRHSAELENALTLADELDRRSEALNKKRREYAECKKSAAKADKELKDIDAQIASLTAAGEQLQADKLIAGLNDIKHKIEERKKYEKLIIDAEKQLLSKSSRVKALQAEHAAAEKEYERKAELYEKARLSAEREIIERGADAIRRGLKAGDVCPVCGEVLKSDPVQSEHNHGDAKSQADAMLKEAENARSVSERLSRDLSAAVTEEKSAKERLDEYKSTLASLPAADKIAAEQIEEKLEKARLLDQLVRQRALKASECKGIADKLDLLTKQGEEDRRDFEERRKKLGDRTREDIKRDIFRTTARIKEIEKEESETRTLADCVAKESAETQSVSAAISAIRAAVADALADKPDDKCESEEAVAARLGEADRARIDIEREKAVSEREAANMESRLKTKREITAERSAAAERYRKVAGLAKMFSRGEFLAFVATEYIKDFTRSASEMLFTLTGGKYTVSYDEDEGEFYVYDFLSGNERRKSTTLSGGETFLASLSMAVALSREIARFGAFDFFFIDEGFGTLHDEAFDQVADVLQKLARTSLVGVVTHRTELMTRMPLTLSVTEADETHGSRCEIVG